MSDEAAAPAAADADPELIEAPTPEGAAEVEPPPGMPPMDESGFQALPWAGGEANELFSSLSAAQSMLTANKEVVDGVMTTAMAMMSPRGSQAIFGTTLATAYGNLKAELVSAGMLQATLEGFEPLPFMMSSLQLAFVGPVPVGGVLQNQMLTPIGLLFTNVNTMGQYSAELLTGGGNPEGLMVKMGAHAWGLLGQGMHGVKGAIEFAHTVVEGEALKASSTITLACTAPFVTAKGEPLEERDPSFSLTAFQRLTPSNTLAATIERTPGEGIQMTAGGTRQMTEHTRLRGKWGTSGILALALEVASEKSSLTLTTELDCSGAAGLSPKFAATLNLSP